MTQITREQLYALLWSEPAARVAKTLGISGPGLARNCRRHGIPVPERGYWARVAAGKDVKKRPLPPRGLGMPSTLQLGRDGPGYGVPRDKLDLDSAPPPAPEFPESMEEVRTRVVQLVGKVRPQRSLEDAVPAILRYVEADHKCRRKILESGYYWDAPKFESPLEQRRLRILNSLCLAALRPGFPVAIDGPEARDLSIRIGEQHVAFKLEFQGGRVPSRAGQRRLPKDANRLRFEITRCDYPGGPLWARSDAAGVPLERVLAEILVELLVTGEQFHRQMAEYRYRWILDQRGQAIEERRRRIDEEERERMAKIEAAKRTKFRRLMRDLRSWRTANDLKAYVAAVQEVLAQRHGPVHGAAPETPLGSWIAWALSVARQLDPIASGRAVVDPLVEE